MVVVEREDEITKESNCIYAIIKPPDLVVNYMYGLTE